VEVDSDTLSVTEKSSSGVVSGGSGNVPTVGGSSQSAPRRETQVVLKVPVAENVEGKKLESTYIIKTNSGNIRIESVTGKYTISADAGDIVVEACNMVDSKENKAGKTKVAAATLNVSEIKSESGDIEVIGATLNSCSIAGKTKNIAVIGATLNSCSITNEAGNIEVTDGIFISENTGENTVKTETGDISVGFDRDQGKIKVQTIQPGLGGRVIKETIYFEGVENPNGQTARLILTTQAGGIEVISK